MVGTFNSPRADPKESLNKKCNRRRARVGATPNPPAAVVKFCGTCAMMNEVQTDCSVGRLPHPS